MIRLRAILLAAAMVVCGFAQEGTKPLETTLCQVVKQPDSFRGKLIEVRAMVDSGVQDLPVGVSDESCSAELKFLTPDEAHLARLLKSGEFRKLTKRLAKKPLVEATVTGLFVQEKNGPGLVLESVKDVVVKNAAK